MGAGCGLVLGGIAQGLCEMAKSGLKEKKKWGLNELSFLTGRK
jgi:hypothetical protein